MNEEEMMAEKIISLIERGKGRDLYDVWFLLKKGVKVDRELLGKKSPSTGTWGHPPLREGIQKRHGTADEQNDPLSTGGNGR